MRGVAPHARERQSSRASRHRFLGLAYVVDDDVTVLVRVARANVRVVLALAVKVIVPRGSVVVVETC